MVALRSVSPWLCASVLVFALASCSSVGRNAREAGRGGEQGALVAGDFRFDALESQPLGQGECGMFLWGRNGEQPILLLAAFASPAEARVRVNGRDRRLRRMNADGASRYGLFENQSFSDDRMTLEVDVVFDENRELTDGVALERGVIRARDAEGWEVVISVGGLIGCGA
jgi:hypothetical protein